MPSANRVLVLVCLVFALSVPTGRPAAAGKLTPQQWREDLHTLDHAIRTDHKFPFHTISEENYTAMVQHLDDAIPTATDQQIIVEMAAIVAAINDGHTRLVGWNRNGDWGFHSYPIALYWFADGLYVRQAHPDYADLVGARVVSIGGHTPEEAQALAERVVSADNVYGKRSGGPHYLISPEVMAILGIVEAGDHAPYVLEKNGRAWRPKIEPLEGEWPGWTRGFVADPTWVDAKDASSAPTPLWRRHVDRAFWMEYLPDEKTLYVQQNQVEDDSDETLESFYARVWDTFEKNHVQKLVLDVRLNGGGNNHLNKPAVTTMVRADATAQTFTILGRMTFSACENLVNELSRWTNTVFVGEPTGERVNFYGDTRTTDLPHCGLSVRASFLWWQNMDPRDTRDALAPDFAADLTFAEYAANRDPAMEAIRDFQGIVTADNAVSLIDADGLTSVTTALREAIHDPRSRYRNMENEINQIGYELLGRRRLDDAIAVLQLNVDEFPDSWNAYDSLGEAYENHGDLQRALDLFRKSVELNPTSPSGLAAVRRLSDRLASTAGSND